MQAKKAARFSLWSAPLLLGIVLAIFAPEVAPRRNNEALFITIVLPFLPLISLSILLSIFARLPVSPLATWAYLSAIIGQTAFILFLLELFLTLPLAEHLWLFFFTFWLLPTGVAVLGIIALGYHTPLRRVGLWRKYPKQANAQLSKWARIPFLIAVITTYSLSGLYVALPESTAQIGMRARIHGALETKLPDITTNVSLVNVFSATHFDWLTSLIRFDATSEEVTQWLRSKCGERPNGRIRGLKSRWSSGFLQSPWSSGIPNWWQPETAERYAEYECDFLDYGEIMIDQTNDERWTVYIYTYDI